MISMKKLYFCLFLLAGIQPAMAQTAAQKQRISEVREAYQQALRQIEMDKEQPEYTDNSLHLTMNRMVPGIGMTHTQVDMFIRNCGDEERIELDWHPYFIREKYNVAARQFVTEFLVNAENGHGVFIFSRRPDDEDVSEYRIYFNADGSFCYATQTVLDNQDNRTVNRVDAGHETVKELTQAFRSLCGWGISTLNHDF